jgi:predicted nucleic acid-binding protein
VAKSKIVYPRKKLQICRDTADNILLECCLAAKADFLITGDKDLLEIRDLPFNLKILSPRKFVEEDKI